MYLIDANVLINAARDYYEFGRVDEYWSWILYQCHIEKVKIPNPIYNEIMSGNDELAIWSKENTKTIILNENLDHSLFNKVLSEGYSVTKENNDPLKVDSDCQLISFAMADISNRTIVTAEKKNNKVGQNRHIPSVCEDLGVKYCDPFEFGRQLNFSTKWEKSL